MLSSRKCMMILSCIALTFHQVSWSTSFSEVYTIWKRYVKQPNQVGEIAPFSQDAARELTRCIVQDEKAPAQHYLEVGGGCGAVSICIAKALRSQDHLDVIEIDPEMCIFLKDRLQWYKNVSVHCCSILDWRCEVMYDGIISTLPFNSLGASLTAQIVAYLEAVAKDGCMLSYVEYPIVRQFLQYFYRTERKAQFQEVQNILKEFRDSYLQKQVMIYLNVPPVMIYHLCIKKNKNYGGNMKRLQLQRMLESYQSAYLEEMVYKKQMLDFMVHHADCFERFCKLGHFTASAWVLNADGTKALLLHHAKLDKWIQLGGHCDGDGDILAVALKEAQEESGIQNIVAISPDIFDIDIHLIPANTREESHYHFDIRFLLQVLDDSPLVQNRESKGLCWVGKDKDSLPTQSWSVLRMLDKWINR